MMIRPLLSISAVPQLVTALTIFPLVPNDVSRLPADVNRSSPVGVATTIFPSDAIRILSTLSALDVPL